METKTYQVHEGHRVYLDGKTYSHPDKVEIDEQRAKSLLRRGSIGKPSDVPDQPQATEDAAVAGSSEHAVAAAEQAQAGGMGADAERKQRTRRA